MAIRIPFKPLWLRSPIKIGAGDFCSFKKHSYFEPLKCSLHFQAFFAVYSCHLRAKGALPSRVRRSLVKYSIPVCEKHLGSKTSSEFVRNII